MDENDSAENIDAYLRRAPDDDVQEQSAISMAFAGIKRQFIVQLIIRVTSA